MFVLFEAVKTANEPYLTNRIATVTCPSGEDFQQSNWTVPPPANITVQQPTQPNDEEKQRREGKPTLISILLKSHTIHKLV